MKTGHRRHPTRPRAYRPGVEALEERWLLATFTVTVTDDKGPGSLREAIAQANARAGADTIAFAIPGSGSHTIFPASPLPAITEAVTIDGTTQPRPQGPGDGQDVILLIGLDGGFLRVESVDAESYAAGLTFQAGLSTMRGLVIEHFEGAGTEVNAEGGVVIADNIIHSNGGGGVVVRSGTGTVIAGNSIHSNGGAGVVVRSGTGTVIAGNNIYSNGGAGVVVRSGAGTVIAGNNIYSNGGAGVVVNAGTGAVIVGNSIHSNGGAGVVAGTGTVIAGNSIHSNGIGLGPGRRMQEDPPQIVAVPVSLWPPAPLSAGTSGTAPPSGGGPLLTGLVIGLEKSFERGRHPIATAGSPRPQGRSTSEENQPAAADRVAGLQSRTSLPRDADGPDRTGPTATTDNYAADLLARLRRRTVGESVATPHPGEATLLVMSGIGLLGRAHRRPAPAAAVGLNARERALAGRRDGRGEL